MADILCNDNRFEVIGKAKQHLLEATNIETSHEEMAALDSFLFRCWQMGWLDRYNDTKADVAPVRHGRWMREDTDPWYGCSSCGSLPLRSIYDSRFEFSNYCPNCGARMDADENAE